MVDFAKHLRKNFPTHPELVEPTNNMLETKIEELTKALNENTTALKAVLGAGGSASTTKGKGKGADAPAADTPTGPTLEEFRAAATKLVDAGQQDTLKKLNSEFGVKRISEVHGTDKQAKAWEKLKAAVDALDSGV